MPTFLDLSLAFATTPPATRRILLAGSTKAGDLADAILDLAGAPEELQSEPVIAGLSGGEETPLVERLADRGAKATFTCGSLSVDVTLEGWMELPETKLERRLTAGTGVLGDHSHCGHSDFDLEHEKHHFDFPPPQPPAGEPVAMLLKEGLSTFDTEVSMHMERGRGTYRALTECCDEFAARLPAELAAHRESFRAACRIAAHSACKDGLVDARGVEAWAAGIVRVVATANGWTTLTTSIVAKKLNTPPARAEASFQALASAWGVEEGSAWFCIPKP